jgi:hypothetical protein
VGDAEDIGPRTNVMLSLGILAGCLVAWLATDTVPRGLVVDPIGPAYFPRFIILSILVLTTMLLLGNLRVLWRGRSTHAPAETRSVVDQAAAADLSTGTPSALVEATLPPLSYPRMAAVFALMLVYVLLLTPLGYFISTMLFVAALLPLLRVRRVGMIVGCALGVPLVLQTLFEKLLGVPLPGGLLDLLPFELPF